MKNLFISVIFVGIVCKAASGLKCYTCNSENDSNCKNEADESYLKECKKKEPKCAVAVLRNTTSNDITFGRKCDLGEIDYCEAIKLAELFRTDVEVLSCRTCDTDECNKSAANHFEPFYHSLLLVLLQQILT